MLTHEMSGVRKKKQKNETRLSGMHVFILFWVVVSSPIRGVGNTENEHLPSGIHIFILLWLRLLLSSEVPKLDGIQFSMLLWTVVSAPTQKNMSRKYEHSWMQDKFSCNFELWFMLLHKVSGVNCFCFTLPIGWEGGRWGQKTLDAKIRPKSTRVNFGGLSTRILRGSYADCSASVFDLWAAEPKSIFSPGNPMRQKFSHFNRYISWNFKPSCTSGK